MNQIFLQPFMPSDQRNHGHEYIYASESLSAILYGFEQLIFIMLLVLCFIFRPVLFEMNLVFSFKMELEFC